MGCPPTVLCSPCPFFSYRIKELSHYPIKLEKVKKSLQYVQHGCLELSNLGPGCGYRRYTGFGYSKRSRSQVSIYIVQYQVKQEDQITKTILSGDSYSQTGFNITGTKPSAAQPLGNPSYPGYTTSGGANVSLLHEIDHASFIIARKPCVISRKSCFFCICFCVEI